MKKTSVAKAIVLCVLFTIGFGIKCVRSSPTKADYNAIFNTHNFSGVVAARVGSQVNTIYKNAFGKLDWQFNVPMPEDAQFPVASNTKLYVAIGLYQLQEEGKVNLTANVSDYLTVTDFENFGVSAAQKGDGTHTQDRYYCPHLPDTPQICESLTFVQLLAMSAGISNEGDQYLPYPGTIGLVVGRYINKPLLFQPGTQYYYSNPSFMLGAYFIEKFSGQSFGGFIKDRIIDPIGLKNTYYQAQDEMFTLDPKRISEFHRYIDPVSKGSVSLGKCTSELQLGSANGAGGIVSNVDDEALLYFTVFNLTGQLNSTTATSSAIGGEILSTASVMEMIKARTSVIGVNMKNAFYAQGLFVRTTRPSTQPIPDQIFYEGMIKCSWTANVYDLTKTPVTMGQAYTNTPVFYVTAEQVQVARQADHSWSNLTGNWPQPPSATILAQNLIDMVTPGEKRE